MILPGEAQSACALEQSKVRHSAPKLHGDYGVQTNIPDPGSHNGKQAIETVEPIPGLVRIGWIV
jgi:hypothetical protein